jgi:hypothetical protein
MQDLGLAPGSDRAFAQSISDDGSVVVGSARIGGWYRAFRWTAENGMEDLSPIPGHEVSDAFDVARNGRLVVGSSLDVTSGERHACLWLDGQPRSLRDLLADDYGLKLGSEWHRLVEITACSADGRMLTGRAFREQELSAFHVTIPWPNDSPRIVCAIPPDSVHVLKAGFALSVSIKGIDDDRDDLTLGCTGLPPTATLTPSSGTRQRAPLEALLNWTPQIADTGTSHEVTVAFAAANGDVISRKFTLFVNSAPGVEPLQPQTLECIDGKHTVTLSTTVDDADDHPLTVTWMVDGQVEQSETKDAGEASTFEFSYHHGVHEVSVEVSDGFETASAGTTITVQDTQRPILVAAEDVVVPTDAGKAFATNVVLPRPTATDASGHAVTLASDAPETYPLGLTLVTWTATDEAGHSATATQKVVVEDREAPTIEGVKGMQFPVDLGQIYSTAKPPVPAASDNVTKAAKLKMTSDAPQRFPIRTTKVTFRATDEAGNFAERIIDVVVVNAPPKANAGRNVVVWTKSERGAKVRLTGSRSFDPDQQPLTFAWSSNKVKLQAAWSAKPVARFPVGGAAVKLVVTDPAGLQSVDTVRVLVKLKNAKRRPRGSDANRSFAAATQEAASAVRTSAAGNAALSGLAYASAAAAYGDAAGEFVRWEEGQTEADALPAYAEIRSLQRTYGQAAANALLVAYAETGDENLLAACGYAVYGTAYVAADLTEE